MAGILTLEEIHSNLETYYKEVYGERKTDEWLGTPAVNVARFVRDGKTVVLNCHITKGSVKEKVYG